MTAQSATISALLEQLHGHGYFRPEAGPLKARLTEAVLSGAEAPGALAGQAPDLEVSIGRAEGEGEIALEIKLDHASGSHRGEITLDQLAEDALQELAGYLTRLVEGAPPAQPAEPGKTAVRKNVLPDSHQEETASARLKVSPQWLKSIIPCTDYSYDEIDGKKYIRDYYWSKELIERLFRIKCSKTTPEDLQYVAKECCHGDLEWARDLIAKLKSPNRGESSTKDPVQKSQAKGTPPVKPAQGERTRSRSRHRRGSRDGNKDGGRKQDPGPGPKPPASH